MANQVRIDLSVEDARGTLAKRTAETKALNKELETTQKLSTGTRTGSRAVAASYSTASENTAYGQARGSMGATGASGRDFANQAQGLGGLVRLYATYAANIFAVSAAFSALSNAMDTSNMIRGLDQLGASSGIALGGLSNQFVKATDGAISFREAMEATAKATSSGLSSAQFLQLGDVAKKASQALGVNMSDAVSRLTRGITKLEPELLDELGIFTKVGKATEDYARKVGKAEANLTDFERRQAFANAVLAEGSKKFSEIDIPSNPYAKFLSALKNTGQTILEVVNKAVVPLINLLSANPTALLAAIGGIAALIVKQALPAIGQYRTELKKAASAALEVAEARSTAAKAAIAARDKEMLAAKDLKAELKTQGIDAAQKALESAQSGRIRKDVRKILEKTPLDVTDKDLAKLDKLGSSLKSQENVYLQLSKAIKTARDANLDYINTAAEVEKRQAKGPGMFSTAGIAASRAESARRSAASKSILSNVGDVAATEGLSAAFGSLTKSLSTEKLGAARTAFTGIAGAVSILGTAVGNVLTVVSRFMGWIGLIIGAYQLLSSAFSKNGAEVSAYEDSIVSLEESTKTATATAKRYGDTLSIDELLAKNNALSETAAAMDKVGSSFLAAKNKASWFDDFTNNISGWFGSSLEDKLVEQMSTSITAAIGVIADPQLKKQAEDQILALTGAKSIDQLKSRLESLNKKEVKELASSLPKALGSIKTQADKAAEPLKSVKDGFTALDKSFQDLSNSLVEKSPITEFASKLSAQAAILQKVFQDPENSVRALNDILKDTSQIRMFPPEVQNSIIEAAKNMSALQTQASEAQKQIDLANQKLAQVAALEASGVDKAIVIRFKLEAEGALKGATDTYVAATTKMKEISANVSSGLNKTIADSIKLIEAPLTRAIAQANIETSKTLLGLLPKTSETIKLQTSLEIESISLRKQELTQTRELINAIKLDRISRETKSIEEKMATASPAEKEKLSKQLIDLKQEEAAYRDPKSLKKSGETLGSGAQEALRQNAGYLAQLEALSGQQRAAKVRGAVEAAGAPFDMQQKAQQDALKFYEAEQKALQSSDNFRSMTLEKQQEILAEYRAGTEALKADIELSNSRKDVATQTAVLEQARLIGAKNIIPLAEQALDRAKAQLATAENTVAAGQKATSQDQARADIAAIQAQRLAKQTIELEHQNELRKIDEDTTSKLQDVRKQELQYLLDIGMISQDKFNQETASLEKSRLLRDKNNQMLQLEASYLVDVTKLLQDYSAATNAGDQANIGAKIVARSAQYESQVSGINNVYSAQSRLLDQQTNLTDRQKSYGDIVKNSFESMGDAMIDWAQTGKWAGKELFNSLIADLARYEMKLQTMEMYKSARPGLMSAVSSLFGGNIGTTMTGSESAAEFLAASGGSLFAKGGAFDYGVEAFAQGGTFTNGIVNSPTLFKFAKGTGLMGEAGPEAIMPLKRDSQGNLGVRGGGSGGDTQVVINNYSTAQAETKETTDSRGNRKIEVTIGDMAAGEIARSGSSTQKSVGSTFGLRPQLIRR